MRTSTLYDDVRARRRRRWATLVGVVLVLAAAGGAWVWIQRPDPADPGVAAAALASSWSAGRIAAAPFTDAVPADLADRYEQLVAGLDADPPRVEVLDVAVPGDGQDPERTSADLRVTWQLPGARAWEYQTVADLRRTAEATAWQVRWDPSLVHPDLTGDLVLRARRTTPARADILSADGTPLVTDRKVIDVGIEPDRVDDLDTLIGAVADELDQRLGVTIDRNRLRSRVQAAKDNAFVLVVTLRDADYQQVRPVIRPLGATVFRTRTIPLAPTRNFAQFTLGSAGPVTAEMLAQNGDRYQRGDTAGRSGLQAAYDERLFGTPGIEVVLAGDGAPDDPVRYAVDPQPGQPVTVTLNSRVQQAADAAVEGTGFPTAMAVVRPSDGQVLALSNSSEATFDIARTGKLPPGSTFKIVTTTALRNETDLSLDTSITCPQAVTVNGRRISNAESEQLGTISFRTAFVDSCNTAFVQLSQELTAGALRTAASTFSLGQDPSIGLPAFGGQVPDTSGPVDLAEASIGQGRNLVSPLAMAGVAATVANGRFPGLSLVLDPPPDTGATRPDPLPTATATILQQLTREVVTDGTGTALDGTPGGEVHGKTGTAQFQSDGQVGTHAWFVGYQGDLAFAVVVTNTPGEYGGAVAAPVARRLLTALASGSGDPDTG